MYTTAQKQIIQDLLARLNEKRSAKHYNHISVKQLPDLHGRNPADLYLVDTYQVRRHWRRRPKRK